MDSLSRYRAAVRHVLSQYAGPGFKGPSANDIQVACVFDEERNHYLVISFGWSGQRRVDGILLHISIHDGKVWIEENNTDCEIASELVAHGVAPEDIVLGFIHPTLRESPFAVA